MNRELKKNLNTLFLCLEIAIFVAAIIINNIYKVIITSKLLLLMLFLLILGEFFRHMIFGKNGVNKEEIFLPKYINIEKIKNKIRQNENYISKEVDSKETQAEIFVEKSVNSIEFIFIRNLVDIISVEQKVGKIFEKCKNKIDKNKKIFYKIYIIAECDKQDELLYEKIFNKIYLKPIYLNGFGFDNNLGSFIIPVVFDKYNNKLCFGSCYTYPTFFYNKREELISSIESIVFEIETDA